MTKCNKAGLVNYFNLIELRSLNFFQTCSSRRPHLYLFVSVAMLVIFVYICVHSCISTWLIPHQCTLWEEVRLPTPENTQREQLITHFSIMSHLAIYCFIFHLVLLFWTYLFDYTEENLVHKKGTESLTRPCDVS